MRHEEARDLLPELTLDLLSGDARSRVIEHLWDCSACTIEAQIYGQAAMAVGLAAANHPETVAASDPFPRIGAEAHERITAAIAARLGLVPDSQPAHANGHAADQAGDGAAAPAERRSRWGLRRRAGEASNGVPAAAAAEPEAAPEPVALPATEHAVALADGPGESGRPGTPSPPPRRFGGFFRRDPANGAAGEEDDDESGAFDDILASLVAAPPPVAAPLPPDPEPGEPVAALPEPLLAVEAEDANIAEPEHPDVEPSDLVTGEPAETPPLPDAVDLAPAVPEGFAIAVADSEPERVDDSASVSPAFVEEQVAPSALVEVEQPADEPVETSPLADAAALAPAVPEGFAIAVADAEPERVDDSASVPPPVVEEQVAPSAQVEVEQPADEPVETDEAFQLAIPEAPVEEPLGPVDAAEVAPLAPAAPEQGSEGRPLEEPAESTAPPPSVDESAAPETQSGRWRWPWRKGSGGDEAELDDDDASDALSDFFYLPTRPAAVRKPVEQAAPEARSVPDPGAAVSLPATVADASAQGPDVEPPPAVGAEAVSIDPALAASVPVAAPADPATLATALSGNDEATERAVDVTALDPVAPEAVVVDEALTRAVAEPMKGGEVATTTGEAAAQPGPNAENAEEPRATSADSPAPARPSIDDLLAGLVTDEDDETLEETHGGGRRRFRGRGRERDHRPALTGGDDDDSSDSLSGPLQAAPPSHLPPRPAAPGPSTKTSERRRGIGRFLGRKSEEAVPETGAVTGRGETATAVVAAPVRPAVITPDDLSLDGYDDDEDLLDEELDEEEERAKIDGAWRGWAVLFGFTTVLALAGLVAGFFLLTDYRNKAMELEAKNDSLAVPLALAPASDDVPVSASGFVDKKGRGLLIVEGIARAPANMRYQFWAQRPNGSYRVVANTNGERTGSSLTVRLRNVPADATEIVVTLESTATSSSNGPTTETLMRGPIPTRK